jgi:hypothetical protein
MATDRWQFDRLIDVTDRLTDMTVVHTVHMFTDRWKHNLSVGIRDRQTYGQDLPHFWTSPVCGLAHGRGTRNTCGLHPRIDQPWTILKTRP